MNMYTYPYPKIGKTLEVHKEALIQALKDMNEKELQELEPDSRKLFDAIMAIADERDELQKKVKMLNKQNEEIYEKYCDLLKENEEWFKARTAIEMIDLLDVED